MTTDTNDIPALAQAFLRQSLAAARNKIRSQKAAQEGDRAAALLFAALAEGQDVHAKKALMFLRGRIESTANNRAEALMEARELSVDMAAWAGGANESGGACCDKASAALLTQMARTLESHRNLADKAEGLQAGEVYVCAICGHIHVSGVAGQGEELGRCPVCQAVPEKFQRVEL